MRATWAAGGLLAAALLGAGGAVYLMRPPAPPPPIAPVAPELGRPVEPVDPAELERVVAAVAARVVADQGAVAARQAREFREGYVALLNAVLAAQGRPQLAPDARPEEVAATARELGAVTLAEETAGPGPHGDTVTATAILPGEGQDVRLLFRWRAPEPPAPAPLVRIERRWFLEAGPALVAPGGYGALVVGGLDGIRLGREGRATLGLRAGAIVSAEPAGYVGAVVRFDWPR